jgi:chromate transporter
VTGEHTTEAGAGAPRPAGHGWLSVFGAFLMIGVTAFGGGSATRAAMRQACLRRGWLTEEQFLDTLVLSNLTPGITILAHTLLIGRRVCGVRGAIAGVSGLMLPAIVITVALAESYELVSRSPRAGAPLFAVAAVAAGFAVAITLQLLRDTLRRGHVIRGPLTFLGYVALAALVHNPLVVLGIALAAGLLFPALFDDRKTLADGETPEDRETPEERETRRDAADEP